MLIGRRVYGLAEILAGVVGIVFAATAKAPSGQLLALGGDGLMILGGIAINLPRRPASLGALALAAWFAVSVLKQAVGLPHDWNVFVTWESLAEPLAMSMGGLVAWSLLGEAGDGRRARAGYGARMVFGLCLLVFGAAHFAYLKFTASMVPAWLPPSQGFWAVVTGVAHIAAGLAILSGVRARLAAVLLTAMFVVFGLLHIPALIRDVASRNNWSEHDVNLLLVGAAWCVADLLSRSRKPA